jgi:hypothetical protein
MAPLGDLVRDLRHATRSLGRSPGHALVVVATLAAFALVLAAWLPARRAASIDPALVLRQE